MSSPYTMDGMEGMEQEEARGAAEAWLGELVVLSFRENRRGGDPIAHTSDGRAVFPDKFQGGDEIRSGEHWLCSVSQKGESTFFAAPVARLDRGFFEGLLPTERERLARIVAQEHADLIANESGEHVAGAGMSSDERGELEARLVELNELYDEALARLSDTEARLAEARDALEGEEVAPGVPAAPAHPGHGVMHHERFAVRRVDGDVLECEAFEDGHYHGHVSPNSRTLFFKSYGRGPLQCSGGRIEVPGLEAIFPSEVEEVEARYDSRHGGFFVQLPR